MHWRTAIPALVTVCCSLSAAPYGARADWPQWRGANRDDISTETGLLKEWPEGGPQRTWLFENCGVGYSGPSVVDDRLYILGGRDGVELLLALDAASGQELWHTEIGSLLENNWGDGPRSTPTVDGDLIYALGAQGTLACVNRSDGTIVWTKTMQDLGGKIPTWGYAESPLVYRDKVICTPGGEQGAIAALNKSTGEVVWQTSDLTNGAHYASAVLAQPDDAAVCVQLLGEKLVGVDADSGQVLWSEGWPGRVAVIPTPVVRDRLVYATSGYGVGCMLVEIGPDQTVQKLYANKIMKNHHGGVILLGDYIYGYSDDRGWLCQDFQTGDAKWSEKSALGKGAIAYADGRFYCLAEDSGDVVLIDASPAGWQERGRFKLDPQTDQRKASGKIWTHPVICQGRLYLRDQNLLFCFDVRDPAASGQTGGAN